MVEVAEGHDFNINLFLWIIIMSKRMLTVKISQGQDISRALLKLTSLAIDEGIFKEAKDRRHFVKPSLKRKLKREEAEKQRAKDFRKELRNASRSEFPWD